MMRVVAVLVLLGVTQAAPVAKTAPLAAKKVEGHVVLSAEQQKTMHSGCVSACRPSPVESKCVTACEVAWMKCVDETGPNEGPEDTKKCQDGVLKHYQETKGIEKKEEKKAEKGAKKEGKKEDKKAEKKAKMFLQLRDVDDEEETVEDGSDFEDTESNEDTENVDATGEETTDEQDGSELDAENEDDSEDEEASTSDEATSDNSEEGSEDGSESDATDEEDESFVQTKVSKRKDDDDEVQDFDEESADEDSSSSEDDEAQIDEETGEDTLSEDTTDDEADTSDESSDESSEADRIADQEAFVQTSSNTSDVDDTEGADSDVADEDATTEDAAEDVAEETSTEDDAENDEGSEHDSEAEDATDGSEEEEALIQTGSSWKPEHGSGYHLYEHPQGSTVVMPCPVESQSNTESCGAYFAGKADGEQCPQLTCSKALGVTMKLTCSGGCCPTCWAPDHVVAMDRHTSISDASVVDSAPQAPSSCGGVKCFELACAPGFTKGHVSGACCYSCVQGR